MSSLYRFVSTLLFVALALNLAQAAERVPITGLDRIVAVVNDDVILASELDERIASVLAKLRESGNRAPPPGVLQKQVMERLIVNRLQLQQADRIGIRIDDDMLNQAIRKIAQQNKLELDEFRRILEADGYQYSDFREQIREEMKIARVKQQQVNRRIRVTDREIDDMITTLAAQRGRDDRYLVSHILINIPEAASPEQIQAKRQLADDILGQLEKGAKFAELAVQYSDAGDALDGGTLGWRKLNEMPRLFSAVVPRLDKGDVSKVLKSASGFHLVHLVDKELGEREIVKQVHARHILIKPNELLSDAEARTRIEQLKQRIEGGDDFATLARSNSDDTTSALRGGDLDWANPGDYVPKFQQMLDSLPVGVLSKPVRTEFGWHIIEVLGRRDHDATEDVRRNEARKLIRKQKLAEETQTWLRELRDNAFVEYRFDDNY